MDTLIYPFVTLAFTASNSARAAKEVFPLRIYNCDCFSSSSASLFQDDVPETDESSRGPFSSPSTAYTLRYRRVPRAARKARLGSARLRAKRVQPAYGEWRRIAAVSAAQHRLRTLWTAPSPRGAL